MIVIFFFKRLVDVKNEKVDFKILPKTNEEHISIPYGCIKFMDSYRFLLKSLDKKTNTLVDNSQKTLKNIKKKLLIMIIY